MTDIRGVFRQFPEVIGAASQLGRPTTARIRPVSSMQISRHVETLQRWRAEGADEKALIVRLNND